MSGTADELAKDSTSGLVHVERQLTREAILVLLDSQMVVSPYLEGRLFQVIRGSGMGLIQSGDITDCPCSAS